MLPLRVRRNRPNRAGALSDVPTRSLGARTLAPVLAAALTDRAAGAICRGDARLTSRAAPAPDLELVTAAVGGENVVVALRGEADLFSAPELKQELHSLVDGGALRIVVDLGQATFLDSTALAVLLGAVKRLRSSGGDLVIVCADRNIRKIFEITHLDRVFELHKSRADALTACGRATHERTRRNGEPKVPLPPKAASRGRRHSVSNASAFAKGAHGGNRPFPPCS